MPEHGDGPERPRQSGGATRRWMPAGFMDVLGCPTRAFDGGMQRAQALPQIHSPLWRCSIWLKGLPRANARYRNGWASHSKSKLPFTRSVHGQVAPCVRSSDRGRRLRFEASLRRSLETPPWPAHGHESRKQGRRLATQDASTESRRDLDGTFS